MDGPAGVAMIRNRFFEDMEAVARGTMQRHHPRSGYGQAVARSKTFTQSLPRAEWQKDPLVDAPERFPWQAGQPNEVYNEFANAMSSTRPRPGQLPVG